MVDGADVGAQELGDPSQHQVTRVVVSALAHGVAPLVAAFVPLIPFFLMPLDEAVAVGTAITLAFLFVLGAYIGSLIEEMIVYTGLRFVIAGSRRPSR